MLLKQQEFSSKTGITRQTVFKWRGEGMPMEPDGFLDYEKVLRWRLAAKTDGRGNAVMNKVQGLLTEFVNSQVPANPVPKTHRIPPRPSSQPQVPAPNTVANTQQIPDKIVQNPDDLGPKQALDRVYLAEKEAYDRVRNSVDTNQPDVAQRLKAWTDMLDALRRMEVEFQKLQESRKQLLPVDLVRESHAIVVSTLKTGLMSLPAKISPMLAHKEWQEIHDILKREINDAFRGCSKSFADLASGQQPVPAAEPASTVEMG
jgi:hypothetical protein